MAEDCFLLYYITTVKSFELNKHIKNNYRGLLCPSLYTFSLVTEEFDKNKNKKTFKGDNLNFNQFN